MIAIRSLVWAIPSSHIQNHLNSMLSTSSISGRQGRLTRLMYAIAMVGVLQACSDDPECEGDSCTQNTPVDMVSTSDMSVGQGAQDMASAPYDFGGFEDMGSTYNEDMAATYDMAAPIEAGLELSHTSVHLPRALNHIEQTRYVRVTNHSYNSIELDEVQVEHSLNPQLNQEDLERIKDTLFFQWITADNSNTLAPFDSAILKVIFVTSSDEFAAMDTTFVDVMVQDQRLLSLLLNEDKPCLTLPQTEAYLPEGAATQHIPLVIATNVRQAGQQITIQNCSPNHALEVRDFYISRNPFELLATDSIAAPALEPGETVEMPLGIGNLSEDVLTSPTYPYLGQLTLTSNALDFDYFNLALTAASASSQCIDPEINILSGNQPLNTSGQNIELTAAPLQTLNISAIIPTTDDLSGVALDWSILSKPESSNTTLISADVGHDLFLDVPGEYIVELNFSAPSLTSCEPRQIKIHAVPTQQLYISTTWTTPGDTDPQDRKGADLDLHYIHPQGSFEDDTFDIFWRNKTADWGNTGPYDDPTLLRDDQDGLGPEVLAHANPEQDLTYRVGVHYFDDNDLGPSLVSTEIFTHGQLTAQSKNIRLSATDTYLSVGSIIWSANPTVQISEVVSVIEP